MAIDKYVVMVDIDVFAKAVSAIDGGCNHCVGEFMKEIFPGISTTEYNKLVRRVNIIDESMDLEEIKE